MACSRSSKEACVARSERVSGSQMLGMPGGIFHRHNLGWEVWGCCWRPVNRCQVAVKHPAGHRQLPTTKICVGIPVMPRSRNPDLNTPPISLPVPSLWVIPVHQTQASCIVHRPGRGRGDSVFGLGLSATPLPSNWTPPARIGRRIRPGVGCPEARGRGSLV